MKPAWLAWLLAGLTLASARDADPMLLAEEAVTGETPADTKDAQAGYTTFNGMKVPPMTDIKGPDFADTIKDGYWWVKHYSPYCGHCLLLFALAVHGAGGEVLEFLESEVVGVQEGGAGGGVGYEACEAGRDIGLEVFGCAGCDGGVEPAGGAHGLAAFCCCGVSCSFSLLRFKSWLRAARWLRRM